MKLPIKLKEREVVEQLGTLTLSELRLWVSEGWVTPQENHSFAEIDVARVRLVCQLRQDLNLNEDAVPVVLSLLDQLHGLRSELKNLAQALEQAHWDRVIKGLDASPASAAEKLLLQAKPGAPKEQRLLAITSLGALGVPEALPFLIEWSTDADADVAAKAKAAITQIHLNPRK